MHWLFVGTYPTGDGPGTGEGIWGVPLDTGTGRLGAPRLLVEAAAPSFVAVSPSGLRLYAVSEQAHGTLSAFAVTLVDGTPVLERQGDEPSGGADPCHVVALEHEVWVSNYSSGTFGVQVLDDAGDLLPGGLVTFEHVGSGPVLDRQGGPHAHSSLATPCGRFAWVMDLGTDEVRRYRRTDGCGSAAGTGDSGTVEPDGTAVVFGPGTGPRHAVVHPRGTAFVVGELDASVHVVQTDRDSGSGVPVTRAPACVTPSREGVVPLPSHVALSPDGTRLYVAVRGPDVVSTFAVHVGGESEPATIEHRADTSVAGVWPRHFAVVEADDGADLLVVANQESSSLVVLRMDPSTGAGVVVSQAQVPAPACVVVA
ncbi:lactonase family protein [Sanguibacter antarcticus]|uniref:6-phosphogluconolactonase (Cycloisomerase 2 family) n=1 Tax=Sanguibacter antarcticus TaxID=372484 RepID=A0A2A9E8V9_9MICO|nr:beta-propeller fold lactonase family protein [Sanguibacter antarcticus]PFG35263.1 6-phosphogluconolactonase (cycloisomerase 2 family) [Sanguibacter antarcticus]